MCNYKPLKHKAAGHDGTLTDKDEMLIFKPLVQQELLFYQTIQERSFKEVETTRGDVPLSSWVPTFVGVLDESVQKDLPLDTAVVVQESNIGTNSGSKKFIVLENLLHGFSQPNILDVKLGRMLHDNNATEEKRKRLREVSRSTTSGSLGFRICGMYLESNKFTRELEPQFYEEEANNNVFINKMFGRTRTKNNINAAFELFLGSDNLTEKRIKQLKEVFLKRIQLLYNTLLDEEIRMVSSSLLFIYEGDQKRWEKLNDQDSLVKNDFIDYNDDDDNEEDDTDIEENGVLNENCMLSSLSLIDFAHTSFVPGKGYDENVVDGIENLMNVFEKLNT